jgi:hypothetical protein
MSAKPGGLPTTIQESPRAHPAMKNTSAIPRIRVPSPSNRAYVDSAPEVRDYFTSGVSDDEAGIWATYLLGRPLTFRPWAQFLVATPTVVATLDAVIATVGAGALAIHFGQLRRRVGGVVPRGLPVLLRRSLNAPVEGIQDSAPERGALSVGRSVKEGALCIAEQGALVR